VLLQGKTAVIYGGGGSIGGAVARAFAREGATVHLTGRTQEGLDRVAEQIRGAGGSVHTAVVDALDEQAIDTHAAAIESGAVATETGEILGPSGIDISLNVIQHGDAQGTPMAQMDVEDYLRPVATAVRTNFLTTRAAARQMMKRRSGVLLFFGGYGDPMRGFNLGGLQTAFHALEAMRSQLASELGPYGIRAVTLQTAGIVDSLPEGEAWTADVIADIESRTMLGRAATLEDVGNAAVFAASDWGRTITASALNITCGTAVG
jgi:3-oxoacyl-[acyl-carrier protein] reductase